MAEDEDEGPRLDHPNRRKPAAKATKAVVILLLLVSVALLIIVTIGGWKVLQGAQAVQIAYILLYLVMAFYVARWSRGVLPMAAALAIILGIFAGIAGPGWFERDASGFAAPTLPASLVGLLTLIIVPVQIVLIAFAARGFAQGWNVEVEVRDDEDYGRGRRPGAEPATA